MIIFKQKFIEWLDEKIKTDKKNFIIYFEVKEKILEIIAEEFGKLEAQ